MTERTRTGRSTASDRLSRPSHGRKVARPSPEPTTRSRPRRTLRLPDSVRPTTIELHFELDPERRTFRGDARYRLRLERRCRQVEMHSAELDVSRARLRTGERWSAIRVVEHPECETIVLCFDRTLSPGEIEIELQFRGQVRDDLRGLYRSSDRDQPWIATQLCPTDARRLFPGFDEPGIKARYAIRVTAPADQTVLSNAPVARRSRSQKGRRTTEFHPTPPLSAYLVAIAVGPFEASRPAICGQTPIRVYTLPGRQPLARFARRAAVASLERLERWFDMPHPYGKLDLLALPDFAFGAMENAGAVFFRDSVLLLDEREASAEDLTRAAETIAHELSHMWFGNLVTMAWWNDLWLNESFATWMAYEIVDDWQPDWRIWLEFIHRRESALEVDALQSSHPIAPPIRTAEEAHENFDAITYTKGASVLRMLERYLGERVFQRGVRRYIRRHREGAARAADLWTALSDAADLPIEKIVAPWTLRQGYPIVRIERRPARGGGESLALDQERFLMLERARTEAKSRRGSMSRWSIPWLGRRGLGARTQEIRHLLTRAREVIPLAGRAPDWIYANASEAGFFRVDHGERGFEELIAALPGLSSLERVGWVGHQWALVRAGRAPIATALELIAALGGDRDPDVLGAVERVLGQLARRLAPVRGRTTETRLRDWIGARLESQVGSREAAGWLAGSSPRNARERRRRARILSILGGLARTEAIVWSCRARVHEHLTTGRALPPGLADEVMRIGATNGDPDLHAEILSRVRQPGTPQARRRSLFALAGFEQAGLARATRRAALDPGLAPAVDRAGLLILMLSSPATAPATWHELQSAWGRLERQMPPILLARIVSATSSTLPPSEAPSIRRFYREHPLAAGSRVLDQVAEELALAAQLEAHAGQALEVYLDAALAVSAVSSR